jgi:hypothetical protein
MPASRLVQDLQTVPSIVGGLGLSVAAAQKALNLDYIENVARCVDMIRELAGQDAADADPQSVGALLKQLAPSRYQFTETTLTARLDLAQRMDRAGAGSLGVAFGAVAVNAAFSFAYGYDYRAAAEVRAVLHAIPANENLFDRLIARAKELGSPTLPETHPVDTELKEMTGNVIQAILAKNPA